MVQKIVDGGDKVRAVLAEISRKVGRGGTVKVGFLAGSTYPDGKSVAMVAAIQEYGAPSRNIPPRPFFRRMLAQDSPAWPGTIAAQLKATGNDVPRVLDQMGALVKGQIQASIIALVDPPLKPATIRRKGFAKPLIDTSDMLKAVAYEVTKP